MDSHNSHKNNMEHSGIIWNQSLYTTGNTFNRSYLKKMLDLSKMS